MRKEEVCVLINNFADSKTASRILKDAGLKEGNMDFCEIYNYLRTDEDDDSWYVGHTTLGRKVITLSQLEELLLPKDKDTYETELMVQSSERIANNIQYRIKTKEEFEATCEKNDDGDYICGENLFVNHMEDLLGRILTVEELEEMSGNDGLSLDGWGITKEMITPVLSVDVVNSEKLQTIKPSTNLKSIHPVFKEIYKEGMYGKKETGNKVDYSEINLDILDLMAQRMMANKHKYPEGNSKKELNIKDLEWALFRHLKKMIKPIEGDEESYRDHLSAILCNASMILDQLELRGE